MSKLNELRQKAEAAAVKETSWEGLEKQVEFRVAATPDIVIALLDVVDAATEMRGAAGYPYDSGFDAVMDILNHKLSTKPEGT